MQGTRGAYCGHPWFSYPSILKRRAILCVLLGLVRSASLAAGPDYLSYEFAPVDQASELPTPFTPLPVEKPTVGLFKSSTEPFFQDLDFSLRPRLYFRSLQNSTGTNNTFAGGGALGFATGWWLDTVQLGVTGDTTILLASNKVGIDRTGLVGSDGQSSPGARTKLGEAKVWPSDRHVLSSAPRTAVHSWRRFPHDSKPIRSVSNRYKTIGQLSLEPRLCRASQVAQ